MIYKESRFISFSAPSMMTVVFLCRLWSYQNAKRSLSFKEQLTPKNSQEIYALSPTILYLFLEKVSENQHIHRRLHSPYNDSAPHKVPKPVSQLSQNQSGAGKGCPTRSLEKLAHSPCGSLNDSNIGGYQTQGCGHKDYIYFKTSVLIPDCIY